MNFHPCEFFNIDGFAHAKLFDGIEAAWEVLGAHLERYIAEHLRPGIRGRVMDGAFLTSGAIFIGEGTVVEPGALIKGPAIIGRNCEVRHAAYIRENVIVGDGCVVGHATELKACVLLDHVEASHFAYVGDSILGNHVMLGAGTKLANFKFDGSEIVLRDGERRIPTGRTKLGSIVGDGSKFGCNSVANPGTVVGRGCRIAGASAVSGVLPAGSRSG